MKQIYGDKGASIEAQKYLFQKLMEMRHELYQGLEEQFKKSVTDLCPDISKRPLYEIEKLPSRLYNCLITFENSTGRTANIENLSKLKPRQLASFLKIKNIGKESLRKLNLVLREYGIDTEL